MKKVVFHVHAGVAGSNDTILLEVPNTYTDSDLDNEAWTLALDNAQQYSIYPTSDLEELSEDELAYLEENDSLDSYSDSIEGWWEPYDSEKHAYLEKK